VAKIEAGSADVSLDLLFRGFFALGGNLSDLTGNKQRELRSRRTARTK
jgi:hypothetical protein